MAERPAWHDRAACRGCDPDLFFPARGDSFGVREAKAICARCPVRAECLTYAVENREKFGVWGASTERSRRLGNRKPVTPRRVYTVRAKAS